MPKPKKSNGEPLYINGGRVPFTFWPENYMRHGPVHAANPWQCLLGFLDSGEASSERCRAYIEQSHDFYAASKNASVTTRPLMLYYSYLNLAKAFLLHREGVCECDLLDHHGLIRDEPPAEYGGLACLTFRAVAEDDQRYYLFPRLVRACGFPPLPSSKSLSLTDMIRQLPGIHDGYTATTGEARSFYPINLEFRHEPDDGRVWVSGRLEDSAYWDDTERQRVQQVLLDSQEWVLSDVHGKQIEFRSATVATYNENPVEVLRGELVEPLRRYLSTEQTPDGFRYHLICDGSFTAQVAANYAVMFVLGMIVRYCPELLANLRSEWLLHEYLATQPAQFAYLLGSGFIRNEILPTPQMA